MILPNTFQCLTGKDSFVSVFYYNEFSLSYYFVLLQVLLREGRARANATDNENSTPLHAASQEGKLNVIEILVRIKKKRKNKDSNSL